MRVETLLVAQLAVTAVLVKLKIAMDQANAGQRAGLVMALKIVQIRHMVQIFAAMIMMVVTAQKVHV
jgi:hypothetical protein